MQATPQHTEQDLFDLAATFSRRQVMDFRIPGTDSTHKVECVVMESSDIAMFAAAIGARGAPGPREVFARPPEEKRRRLADHLEDARQRVLEPDGMAIAGEGGHDAIADYAQRTGLASRPRERMMTAAIELLASQAIAAGGLWPVPGTDPQVYVVIGTADQVPELMRDIDQVPAE